MGFQEVPKDLTERAQILLRSEAGLQSYNPTHPSLPSVEEIISGFDPSPDSVQCTHCNAKLLRGSQSLLCVYCGRQISLDISPHPPISFNSTTGFRWLLQSLALDGSEMVEPSEEDGQLNRGRNPVKDGISLSNYLNLEMKWPAEAERFGLTDADELKIQRPLQLAGLSFINALSQKQSESSASIPPWGGVSSEKSIEFEAFPALGSLHLSEKQEFCDVKPGEGKHDDSLSVWKADFQAASSVAPHDDFESSHLKSPSVDYYPPMDSKNDKWLQETEHKKKRSESDDDKMAGRHDFLDSWKNHNSTTGLGSDQGLTSCKFVSNTAKSSKNNDASESDVWNDFASSAETGDNQHQTSSVRVSEEDDSFYVWNGFTSPGVVPDSQLASRGVNSAEEMSVSVGNDMFGPWSDVTSLTSVPEREQKEYGDVAISKETANPKDSVEFGSDYSSLSYLGDKLKNPTPSSVDKMNDKDEESLDPWDNFLGSTVVQLNPGESNSVKLAGSHLNGEGDDRDDGLNDFTRLTNSSINEQKINSAEIHNCEENDKDDDSWNAFTSASRPETKSLSEDSGWSWADISNQNIQQEAVGQQTFEVRIVTENDDSLSSWSDLASSSNAAKNKLQTMTPVNSITGADSLSQSWNDFPSSMGKAGEDHTGEMEVSETNLVEDNDVLNSWFGLTSSSVSLNNQQHNSGAGMSDADGFFTDQSSSRLTSTKDAVDHQLSMGGDSVPDIMKTNENYDSFDAWSDLTGTKNWPGNQKESQVGDKQAVARDGPFDAWNLLMSSAGSQTNNDNVAPAERASETSFFNSPANMESAGLSSTAHPVMLPDAASTEIGSANLDISSSETLDLFRDQNGNAKSSIIEQIEKVEHVPEETSRKKPINAEALISQMHDLSFMLESDLSVPKRVD